MSEPNGTGEGGNQRLDRIERALNLMLDDHIQFREEHKLLLSAQVMMQGGLEQLRNNIDSLERQMRTIGERVDGLAACVETTTANIDALTARVDALSGRVETTTANVDALTVRIDALAGRVETTTANVDALTVRVQTTTGNVDALTANVEAMRQNFDQRLKRIEQL